MLLSRLLSLARVRAKGRSVGRGLGERPNSSGWPEALWPTELFAEPPRPGSSRSPKEISRESRAEASSARTSLTGRKRPADSPEDGFFRFRSGQRAGLGFRPRLLATPAGHGGGGGGAHAGPGAHPGADGLPGHQRRRRPGVGRRLGERRAHGGRDGGAGEHGLRLPAAAGPGAALPPRLRGLRGTFPAGDRLRPEALRGEAAQQRPGARGGLSGAEGASSCLPAEGPASPPPRVTPAPPAAAVKEEREANGPLLLSLSSSSPPPMNGPSHHLPSPSWHLACW